MNRPDLELDPDILEMIEQDGLQRWIKPLEAFRESPEPMLLKIRNDYKHIAPSFLVICDVSLIRCSDRLSCAAPLPPYHEPFAQ